MGLEHSSPICLSSGESSHTTEATRHPKKRPVIDLGSSSDGDTTPPPLKRRKPCQIIDLCTPSPEPAAPPMAPPSSSKSKRSKTPKSLKNEPSSTPYPGLSLPGCIVASPKQASSSAKASSATKAAPRSATPTASTSQSPKPKPSTSKAHNQPSPSPRRLRSTTPMPSVKPPSKLRSHDKSQSATPQKTSGTPRSSHSKGSPAAKAPPSTKSVRKTPKVGASAARERLRSGTPRALSATPTQNKASARPSGSVAHEVTSPCNLKTPQSPKSSRRKRCFSPSSISTHFSEAHSPRSHKKPLAQAPSFEAVPENTSTPHSRGISVEVSERFEWIPPCRASSVLKEESGALDSDLEVARHLTPRVQASRKSKRKSEEESPGSSSGSSKRAKNAKSTSSSPADKEGPMRAPLPVVKVARLPGESVLDWRKRMQASQAAQILAARAEDDSKDDKPREDDDDDDQESWEAANARKRAQLLAEEEEEKMEELEDENRIISAAMARVKEEARQTRARSTSRLPSEKPRSKKKKQAGYDLNFGGLLEDDQFFRKLKKEHKARLKLGVVSTEEANDIESKLADEGENSLSMSMSGRVGDSGKLSKAERQLLKQQGKNLWGGNATVDKALDAVFEEDLDDDEELAQQDKERRRFWTGIMRPVPEPADPVLTTEPYRLVFLALKACHKDDTFIPDGLLAYIPSLPYSDDPTRLLHWVFAKLMSHTLSLGAANAMMAAFAAVVKRLSTQALGFPLNAANIVSVLLDLGAKRSIGVLVRNGKEKDTSDADEEMQLVPLYDRTPVLLRLLRTIEICASHPWATSNGQTHLLLQMLQFMAFDPETTPLYSDYERVFAAVMHIEAKDNAEEIYKFYKAAWTQGKDQNRRCQLSLVSFLPHATSRDFQLRRWLALSFLRHTEVQDLPSGLAKSPPLKTLSSFILNKSGPFTAAKDTDNAALYQSTQLLQVLLSHLWEEMIQEDPSVRNQLEQIRTALAKVDSRINAAVRGGDPMRHKARNAITRLAHSLCLLSGVRKPFIRLLNSLYDMERPSMQRQTSLPDYKIAMEQHPYPPVPPFVSKTAPSMLLHRDIGAWAYPMLTGVLLLLPFFIVTSCLLPGTAIIAYFDQLSGTAVFAVGLYKADPYWSTKDVVPPSGVRGAITAAHILGFVFLLGSMATLLLKRLRPCLPQARNLAFYNFFWAFFALTEVFLGLAWVADWAMLSHANNRGLDSDGMTIIFSGGPIAKRMPVACLFVLSAGLFAALYQKQERAMATEEAKASAALAPGIPMGSASTTFDQMSAEPMTISGVEQGARVQGRSSSVGV